MATVLMDKYILLESCLVLATYSKTLSKSGDFLLFFSEYGDLRKNPKIPFVRFDSPKRQLAKIRHRKKRCVLIT
jgi:hypothetical protein